MGAISLRDDSIEKKSDQNYRIGDLPTTWVVPQPRINNLTEFDFLRNSGSQSASCIKQGFRTFGSTKKRKKRKKQKKPLNSVQVKPTRPPFKFQAIGVIEGEISFDGQSRANIAAHGQTYPLLDLPGQRFNLSALQKHIKETGNAAVRLVVYPKAIHFPDKETPQQIQFQLLRFEPGETRFGVSQNLNNMEFQIAGFWQFIPACRIPCISVFKNFSRQRLEWIKQANAGERVRFMEPVHLPVIWEPAPVGPSKYNPKAKQQQQQAAFCQVKAKFLPHKDAFGVSLRLAPPITDTAQAPKYLEVNKKDKQLAKSA